MAVGQLIDRYGRPLDGATADPQQQQQQAAAPNYGNYNASVSSLYQQHLGRTPDANELASDSENYGKYGEAQLVSNLQERARQRNGAASGGVTAAPGGANPASGGFSNAPRDSFQKVSYDPYKYNFSNLPAPNFTQFQRPDYSNVENPSLGLAQPLVTNPHTLTPEVIAAMKERQKEEALAMQGQFTGDLARLQGHGMVGAANALERQYAGDLVGKLTGAYRDTDLAAINQNRQDELNALQGADQVLANNLARQTSGYNTQLQGQQSQWQSALQQAALQDARQQAQAGENQFAAQFQLQNNQAASDSYSQALSQELAQRQFMEMMRQFNAQQANQLMLAGFNANQVRPNI